MFPTDVNCLAGLDSLSGPRIYFVFSYKIDEETKYGGINSDGTWNGMVGHVKRQVSALTGETGDGSLRTC